MSEKIIESGCGNVTTLAGDEVAKEIYVSDIAQTKITEILSEQTDNSFLRVAISGGGCSGFQYMFGIDDDLEDTDIVSEWNGGKVVVDEMSIQFIKGATIDYIEEFGSEYFAVNNPSASSSCGCGSSFAYDDPMDFGDYE